MKDGSRRPVYIVRARWTGVPVVARATFSKGRRRPDREPARDVAIMSEISNIGISSSLGQSYRVATPSSADPAFRGAQTDSLGESDPVEFSRMGRILADAMETSSLRLAKIQALRSEIAEGTFETPERIEGTVDRLIRELG